jgi:hypothetical protein
MLSGSNPWFKPAGGGDSSATKASPVKRSVTKGSASKENSTQKRLNITATPDFLQPSKSLLDFGTATPNKVGGLVFTSPAVLLPSVTQPQLQPQLQPQSQSQPQSSIESAESVESMRSPLAALALVPQPATTVTLPTSIPVPPVASNSITPLKKAPGSTVRRPASTQVKPIKKASVLLLSQGALQVEVTGGGLCRSDPVPRLLT